LPLRLLGSCLVRGAVWPWRRSLGCLCLKLPPLRRSGAPVLTVSTSPLVVAPGVARPGCCFPSLYTSASSSSLGLPSAVCLRLFSVSFAGRRGLDGSARGLHAYAPLRLFSFFVLAPFFGPHCLPAVFWSASAALPSPRASPPRWGARLGVVLPTSPARSAFAPCPFLASATGPLRGATPYFHLAEPVLRPLDAGPRLATRPTLGQLACSPFFPYRRVRCLHSACGGASRGFLPHRPFVPLTTLRAAAVAGPAACPAR